MGGKVSGSGRLHFAYRVVLPVMATVGITVATAAGFAYWSTAKSDDRALARETHLVQQVISAEMKTLAEQQTYYSEWDEAVTALKDKDLDWIDENLASELYSADHFDRIYVLDPAGRPLYAMQGGGKTETPRPIARRWRRSSRSSRRSAPTARSLPTTAATARPYPTSRRSRRSTDVRPMSG